MIRYMIYLVKQLLRAQEEPVPQNAQSRPRLKSRRITVVLRPGTAKKTMMYSDIFNTECTAGEETHRFVQICPNCKSGITRSCRRCPRCGREIKALYSETP